MSRFQSGLQRPPKIEKNINSKPYRMKGATTARNSNVAATVAASTASHIFVTIDVSEDIAGCDDAAQGAVHHGHSPTPMSRFYKLGTTSQQDSATIFVAYLLRNDLVLKPVESYFRF
jgi:hypothetical protein